MGEIIEFDFHHPPDVIKILNDQMNRLEDYDFTNIIKKYDTNEYIICLIYKENNNYRKHNNLSFKLFRNDLHRWSDYLTRNQSKHNQH